jgi:hypothetical protein
VSGLDHNEIRSERIISLPVTQCYLEMARSFCVEIERFTKKLEKEEFHEGWIDPIASISFSLSSVVILYSYLSLESFTNYNLYQIWEKSKKDHQIYETHKQENPNFPEPPSQSFYYEYGHHNDFRQLKHTKLKDLSMRIKVLCEGLGIPKIHESNPKLWQNFTELLEQTRHFLVHPYPDSTKFDNVSKSVLEKNAFEYVQIAQMIIKHFFIETNDIVPEWVENNVLLSIKGFEYYYKK